MQTSRTTNKPAREKPNPADEPWPDGVTARILTRYGLVYDAFTATVDIYGSHAICGPCGWTSRHSAVRNEVLDGAAKHANTCMAMPHPGPNTAIHHSA